MRYKLTNTQVVYVLSKLGEDVIIDIPDMALDREWKPVNTRIYECRGGICAICVCTEVEGVPCGDPGDDPKDLDACRNCGRKYQMVIEVLEDPLFKPEVKRS